MSLDLSRTIMRRIRLNYVWALGWDLIFTILSFGGGDAHLHIWATGQAGAGGCCSPAGGLIVARDSPCAGTMHS